MSADNIILVQKIGKKYYVWMDFCSDDDYGKNPLDKHPEIFDTEEKAMAKAFEIVASDVVEYGVSYLDELL